MIIDCHGHYTTAPAPLQTFRDAQIAALKTGADIPLSAAAPISDDQIRDSLENAQLKLQRERGTDLTIFSPRAAGMGHHLGDASTSEAWATAPRVTPAARTAAPRKCPLSLRMLRAFMVVILLEITGRPWGRG